MLGALKGAGSKLVDAWPQIRQGVEMADSAQKMFGPQGSLAQGNIGDAMSQGTQMFNTGRSLGRSLGLLDEEDPTTMSKFNMLPSEFSQLPPEVRQEMLRRVMGR
jgi:hypothetical protein